MESINLLFKQDIVPIILGIFIIMSAVIAVFSIIGKFSEIIGKPVKWIQKKNQDHELLIQTAQNLSILQGKHAEDVKQSDAHDDELRKDLKLLTDMFVEKQINDYRWEIINFADKISSNKKLSKEYYKHCFHTYEQYEKIIEENGLTNGEVELSMEIINQSYKEKLKSGF